MDTIIVQLTSPKTMNLIMDLEDLNLLKVIKKSDSADINLSDKYAGKLSVDVAEKLQKHVEQSREEWDNSL